MNASSRPAKLPRRISAEGAYHVLLRLYPPAFRKEYGEEMMQLFRDQWRTSPSHRDTLWVSILLDLLRSAPRLRLEEWRARRGKDNPTAGGIMKPVAIFAALIGAFGTLNALAEGTAGARGVFDGTYVVSVGTGVVAGALLLTAGVAMLRGAPSSRRTARVAALASLACVVIARLASPWMSVVSLIVGVALPVVMNVALYWSSGSDSQARTV